MLKKYLLLCISMAMMMSACNNDNDDNDPICGNGVVEGDEQCDDSNDVDDDECSNTCIKNEQVPLDNEPKCGDGKVEGDEQCDDSNDVDDDECSNTCIKNEQVPLDNEPKCGNGVVEGDEQCDDGNDIDDDECSNTCIKNEQVPLDNEPKCSSDGFSANPGAKTKCGDNILEAGEICEVGQINNTNPDWKCINDKGSCYWKTPKIACGNGVVEDGEECDDANTVRADGCYNCKNESDQVCQMRNGSEGDVLLVVDGDTLKIRLTNDGKCKDKKIVTVRMHGIDSPECLKTKTTSPIDPSYNEANACDPNQSEVCSKDLSASEYQECLYHNERGGYDAAAYLNNIIYSDENKGHVTISCETVSDKDPTCLLDNTRTRYLAYIGAIRDKACIDVAEEMVHAGYAMVFTAFTAQRTETYCAAEKEAVANQAGVWSYGNSFDEVVKEYFSEEKQSWLVSGHCDE